MSKINKNGAPRKVGSGRTAGATSLVSVQLKDLTAKFAANDMIVCGRIFLKKAGIEASAPAVSPVPADVKSGITLVTT